MVPDEDVVLKCDSLSNREKNVVCATLFYCANWFREDSSNRDSPTTDFNLLLNQDNLATDNH